jgi:ribonuclease HII
MIKKMTVKQVKDMLETIQDERDPLFGKLAADSRKGVQSLVAKWRREKKKAMAEFQRYCEMTKYEKEARDLGYGLIAGIDEAGRGPLAGPVVSAAVILPENCFIEGLNDSKQLAEAKRLGIYKKIMEKATAVGVGIVSAQEIDQLNIHRAVKKSMHAAISALSIQPDFLLVDAMELDVPFACKSIIKGDAASVSIAAASVVAKVTRDKLMNEYAAQFPEYGFDTHKGYGTAGHLAALRQHGPCPIHRKSFAPVKEHSGC